MPAASKKVILEFTEAELLKMTRAELTLSLNDREIEFCEFYYSKKNVKTSAIKAGYSKKSAHITGWKLRQRKDINNYIGWLKVKLAKKCDVNAMDLIDSYIRIAFADMADFVDLINGRYIPKQMDEIDGTIVSKIVDNKHGFSIELEDRFKALDKLEKYFDVMPKDWKYKIENKKLELMQMRLELDKEKAGVLESEETNESNFLEALGNTAKEVWSDGSVEEVVIEDNEKWSDEINEDDGWED